MRPKDVIGAISSMVPSLLADESGSRFGIWIHGAPGVGKTDCVGQACSDLGVPLWRFPPTITLDPVDVRGLPTIENGQTIWARPDLWPSDPEWKGVVFLDELPQGSVAVMSSLMQAVHSMRIGGMELPKGTVFIACGNRQEDRAGANRVITPLLNRFVHLDFEVSNEDWLAWASGAGVDPEIRGFIGFRPELLHQFDPSRNERAFPTPRSWHFVAKVLRSTPEALLMPIVAGLVGEGPAAEFIGFLRTYRHLPDMNAVLSKPATAAIPKDEPAVMYALCAAIGEHSKKLDDLNDLAIYARRFPGEFSALCLRDVFGANSTRSAGRLRASPKLLKGEMSKWTRDHGDVLFDGAK